MTTARTFHRHPPSAIVDDEQCRRASVIVEFLGRRWTSAILLALGQGATRFGEIEASVLGISARMLTVRLRELDQAGLILRHVEPTMPVSISYHLTDQGRDLLDSMQALVAYGRRWGIGDGAPAR